MGALCMGFRTPRGPAALRQEEPSAALAVIWCPLAWNAFCDTFPEEEWPLCWAVGQRCAPQESLSMPPPAGLAAGRSSPGLMGMSPAGHNSLDSIGAWLLAFPTDWKSLLAGRG